MHIGIPGAGVIPIASVGSGLRKPFLRVARIGLRFSLRSSIAVMRQGSRGLHRLLAPRAHSHVENGSRNSEHGECSQCHHRHGWCTLTHARLRYCAALSATGDSASLTTDISYTKCCCNILFQQVSACVALTVFTSREIPHNPETHHIVRLA